ncbi:unnamed protein product [Ixodes hexagonus]
MDITFLQEYLAQVAACKESFNLQRTWEMRSGLASVITATCDFCGMKSVLQTSALVGGAHEVNVRFSYALRSIGKGRESGALLCALMNMAPPSTKMMNFNKKLLEATKKTAEKSMQAAEAKALAGDESIAVNVDGTRMKRGHSSLCGVVTAISADTGKVLDCETESKFCLCARSQHTDENRHLCNNTHAVSSGAMEASGAVKIFTRSFETRGLKYTSYIVDGDSKAFLAVRDAKPYDSDVEKHKCIGHVQKRMGTRLRNIKKCLKGETLADGKA